MDETQILHELENRLIPVTKWNDYHIWPPIGGLRHLIFNKKTNGFDRVLRKVGRRLLIDEASFREWIEWQQSRYNYNSHITR